MSGEVVEKGIGKYINLKKWGFTSFELKIIAMVLMVMDHFAIFFLVNHQRLYLIFRGAGRLSFPIFCFLLVEGFYYTENRLKHGILLGAFALISEIPYNMLYGTIFYLDKQNVMLALFIGYMVIWGLDSVAAYRVNYPKKLINKVSVLYLNIVLEVAIMVVGFAGACFLRVSYSYGAVMLIVCFYGLRGKHFATALSNIAFNCGMFPLGLQWIGAFSVIPIELYNGKPGKHKAKYFFYIFYPAHIFVLGLLKKIFLLIF